MTIYVLMGDVSDDDEEPFDKEKLEGVFSSLQKAELYITECVDERTEFKWEPMYTFEHVPYLQTREFRVYIETVDEGSWRRFGKTVMAGVEGDDGDVKVNAPTEVERLSAMFAEALNLTVQEFNERY